MAGYADDLRILVELRVRDEGGQTTSPERIPSRQELLDSIPDGKYILLLADGQGERRFFARKVGDGVNGDAQLLLGPDANAPSETSKCYSTVRKIAHELLDQAQIQKKPIGKEVQVFELLERHLPNANGLTPRYARLTSSGDVEIQHGFPGCGRLWARTTYWDYYNGGTVGSTVRRYDTHAGSVPRWLTARFAHQILQTLQFMYHVVSPAVIHSDLHKDNILLHFPAAGAAPDFYIIDFGEARIEGDVIRDSDLEAKHPLNMGAFDIYRFLSTFEGMVLADDKRDQNSLLGGLLRDLEALRDGYQDAPAIPDLQPFINRARDMEAQFFAQDPSRDVLGERSMSLLPTVFSTLQEASGAQLHGPFEIARKSGQGFDVETPALPFLGDLLPPY